MKSLKFAMGALIGSTLLTGSHALADDAKVKAAADVLVEILTPRMQTLDRDLVTFHYQMVNADTNYKSPTQVFNRLRGGPERFYSANLFNYDMAGVGLYAAIDPTSSRSFGGTAPHLYVIPLKKGTRFVNVVSDATNDDLTKAKKIFNDLGCGERSDTNSFSTKLDSFSNIPGSFRNSAVMDCRNAIIDAFARMRVQVILYPYSAASYANGCRSRGEAMNIIDSSAIRADQVSFYSDSEKVEGLKASRYISHLYRSANQDFTTRLYNDESTAQAAPKTLADLSVIFIQAFRSWKSKNIFKCGSPWALETNAEGGTDTASAFTNRMNRSYADKDVQDAEVAWMRSWRKRAVSQNFSSGLFARIKMVEKAAYETSGLADRGLSLEKYREATDLLENYKMDDKVRSTKAAEIVNEPYSMPSYTENPSFFTDLMKKMGTGGGPNPGIYPLVLKMAGVGPVLTRMQFNAYAPNVGGTVLITKGIPMGDSAADFAILAESKKKYLEILFRCTLENQRSEISNDDLQKSDCGVRFGPQS